MYYIVFSIPHPLAVWSFITIFAPFVLAGCGSNDVKKTKDFITVGMYPQAMELLKKRIGENPKDAEAQFLLGSCYIHTDNLSGAGY